MINRLVKRIPRRWLVPAWIGAAASATGLLIGIHHLLRAFDQEPLVWLGWILIATGAVSAVHAVGDVIGRHVVADRANPATVPEWLEDDWDELCERAGINPSRDIDQYAAIDGMTTVTTNEHLREQLVIRPTLVEQPRPLVRYTLAVQAARIAADLTTAPATVLHVTGHVLAWLAWMLAGIAAVSGNPWLLLAMVAGAFLAGGLVEIAETIGHRIHSAADYIAQTYLREHLTTSAATAAETSPTWQYARFEPALDERVSLDDTAQVTGTLDQAASDNDPRQLNGAADPASSSWRTVITGGER